MKRTSLSFTYLCIVFGLASVVGSSSCSTEDSSALDIERFCNANCRYETDCYGEDSDFTFDECTAYCNSDVEDVEDVELSQADIECTTRETELLECLNQHQICSETTGNIDVCEDEWDRGWVSCTYAAYEDAVNSRSNNERRQKATALCPEFCGVANECGLEADLAACESECIARVHVEDSLCAEVELQLLECNHGAECQYESICDETRYDAQVACDRKGPELGADGSLPSASIGH